MRVLLVQPLHRDTFGYSMPPLGPLHLGAAARARGHDVTFDDLALAVRCGELPAGDASESADGPAGDPLVAACAKRLLVHEPDVLGIGAMISSMPMALHLAAAVKAARPELPVILGGQGPETVEEAIIARYPQIDAVAVGEADVTFVEWLDALEAGGLDAPHAADVGRLTAAVPGLVVRVDGRPVRTPPRAVLADLDDVPPPAWDLAESPAAYAAAAGSDEGLFPIDLGRGCTYACTFCTTPGFWGRAARHLSPARAVDELDRLAALDGIGCAYVTHDLFTFDRARVLAICDEKIRRGNVLPFECRTRIDLVDGALLARLREAGCRRILYGIESDSPDVLRAVNKGGRVVARTAEPELTAVRGRGSDTADLSFDHRAALRTAAEQGVASIVGIMCGIPGETADDVEASLQLAAEAAVLDGVSLSLHWFNVTPGNGQAARAGGELQLLRGITADLVRGFDLPAGHVTEEQWRMIEADPEVFAAFRVTVPEWAQEARTAAQDLYVLTRNAHLILEVFPRTTRALAHQNGSTLLATLLDVLRRTVTTVDPEDEATWAEPLVLQRKAVVAHFAHVARATGAPAVTALADYEQALHETSETQLIRFAVDPLPLVRAMDGDRWDDAVAASPRPSTGTGAALPAPGAALFTREGDRVQAHALSPFLADAVEIADDAALRERWPEASAEKVAEAREVLASLR